ncbi:MAG: creatininase family protein [Candidatus Obscuribacterales bacterium]|nr:creatininase family protein [Candidatus Obscuribacterales bacterium]
MEKRQQNIEKKNNDWLLVQYLKERIIRHLPVLVRLTVNYSFYPAMVDYPGTVSLSEQTASALIVDILTALLRFGPERFYLINTGRAYRP